MKEILSEDEVFAEFARRFPAKAKQKKIVLSENEIETYNSVWKEEFTSRRGRYKKEFFDGKKEAKYKNCLFTIYKHHWDTDDGFQINMKNAGKMTGKSVPTVSRMIVFFNECGLLKRNETVKYVVSEHTYYYHKNSALFNYLFRGLSDDYKNWLYQIKSSDIDNSQHRVNSHNNNNNSLNDINNVPDICPNVFTNRSGKKTDLDSFPVVDNGTIDSNDICSNKLYNQNDNVDTQYNCSNEPNIYPNVFTNRNLYQRIADEFLPVIDQLNEKQHPDLQINFGLHFDNKGNCSGRSFSYFCLTLNENKEHNSDNSMETRNEFLKRMNLSDYREVYDIKSEVPRTTILANTGIWKPDDYDIYTEFLKECNAIINQNESVYTQDMLSKMDQIYTRNIIKELYMRFNFGTGTDKQRFNYYRNSRIKKLQKEYGLNSFNDAESFYYYRLQDDSKYDISDAYWHGTELEYMFDEWVGLRKAIEKIQGKSWGNLVFWFTSMIQVYTIYKIFKEKKIRVYNVYDGFYAPPAIGKEYMINMVEQSADYIYEKYIKGLKI